MDFSTINWLAVIVAAISSFLIGGLWYSPMLFAKPWMKANGFTEEDLKGANMGKVFGLSFLWALVMSANLAMFLNDPKTDAAFGAFAGFAAGFGWVAMGFFIVGLFERRSTGWMLINGAYMVVALTVMGLILGAWR
ncbi:MAG: DUF1761 domain-containing protein [Saprospiraceae bacterium]|nr:DUF1761 domain-containing protein [Saprospiraceae bacterium]